MVASALLARALALPSVPYTERRARLPDRPGLYFVIRDNQEVMYIGMSRKSIQRRWKTWHHVVCDVENSGLIARTRIAYIVYADINRIADDERAAIHEFRPSFNFNHVPGAFERQQRLNAEACVWTDCRWHNHRQWPSLVATTGGPAPSFFP